jgi:GxxExxY protein
MKNFFDLNPLLFIEKIENELATLILDKAFYIHRELGPGLLESIYECVLIYELKSQGLRLRAK